VPGDLWTLRAPVALDLVLSVTLALIAVAAGVILFFAGAAFASAAFAAVAVARDSRTWPTVAGRVVRSEIRPNRRANGLPGYRTLVRYEYTVDGEAYEGRDLASGDFPYRSARSATRRLQPYALGSAVVVRYFPAEPEIAVLEPGISPDVLYLPVVASILLLSALGLAAWGGLRLFTAFAT
jgi:hypothetical protein